MDTGRQCLEGLLPCSSILEPTHSVGGIGNGDYITNQSSRGFWNEENTK
ncbi:hypothetical protein Pint_19952 [Pistacia integerrima]|uniref:Uncharacterized protein n=1 Tax=Pistacia integerrima TaxID=434235 RepID=A0ACC0XBV9_9ROSI|nr:hypothetical protein Pint_19952 [Pistacia integerrima]